MRRDRVCRQAGFTLLEVLVALTLGSLVVLLAHRLLVGVTDGAARLGAAREALDRDANARRWLVEALGSLDVAQEHGGPFAGRSDRLEFSTWLRVAHGWLEPRRVTLGRQAERFVATLGPEGNVLVLFDAVADARFDYLLEPGADARWVREWLSPVSAPLAVRLRVTYRGSGTGDEGRVDTLLLMVGPRG